MKKRSYAWPFVLAFIWVIVTLYPYAFMFITSFKTNAEFMNGNTFGLPQQFFIGNYTHVLSGRFPIYLKNSIIIVVVCVILILLFSSMAAYIFTRVEYKIIKIAYAIVIACMSIPIHVSYIPVFMMAKKTGLYDSIWALIFPYVAFQLPVSCFIMTGFMKNIPHEIIEAAQIDGASMFRTYRSVALPLSRPALVTLAIYDGVNLWNEFSFAMILTNNPVNRTLPLAVWDYKTEFQSDMTAIITVLALATIPMLVLFCCAQDKLVKGMMVGAVKG